MRKRFYGDTRTAQAYTRHAAVLMNTLKGDMKMNNLQQLSRRVILANGVVMAVSSVFGQDTLQIFAPELKIRPLPKPEKRRERLLDFYIIYQGAIHKLDPATGLPVQSSAVETDPDHIPAMSLAHSKKTDLLYAMTNSILIPNAEAGVAVYTREGLEKQRVVPFEPGYVPALQDMHMSLDGNRLVAYDPGRVYVMDVETEAVGHWDTVVSAEDGPGLVTAVAISPDGATVYVAAAYSRFELPDGFRDGYPPETPYPSADHHYTLLYAVDAASLTQVGVTRLGGSYQLNALPQYLPNTAPSLAVSRDGTTLYAPVDSEGIKVVVAAGPTVSSAVGHPNSVFTSEVAVAFGGDLLLTAAAMGSPEAMRASVLTLPGLQVDQSLPVSFKAFYDSVRIASADGMHFYASYESPIGGFGGVNKFAMYQDGLERYVHTVQGSDTSRMLVSNVAIVETFKDIDVPAGEPDHEVFLDTRSPI